jgi:hypothetical protein
VRVPRAEAEIARARLLRLAPGGFEEADAGACIVLRVYTDAGGERRVREEFPNASSTVVEPGREERWRTFHVFEAGIRSRASGSRARRRICSPPARTP